MASKIDFSNLTFSDKEVRAVRELLFDAVIKAPEITDRVTLYDNTVFNEEVGFIGDGGLIGKSGFGCNPSADDYKAVVRKMTWTPKNWSTRLVECFSDLENTLVVYCMNKGVTRADLTSTDYAAVLEQLLENSMKDFVWRVMFFNDTAITSASLTSGVSTDYFSIIDGIFKQCAAQVTANAKQGVTITENAGASYSAQEITTPANVKDYLEKMYYQADMRLRQMDGNFILCTQSFYDGYARYLSGKDLESTYRNMVDGQGNLTFNGVPLIAVPTWDKIIRSYMDNGTKFVNPHRALFTNKAVLGLAVDSYDSFANFQTWFEKKDRQVYTDIAGKVDAKLMNPELFVYAC